MDCSGFKKRLDLLLGGGMTRAQEREAHEHMMRCARCRELLEIARGELDILPGDQQEDLTAAILEATSGSACTRVEELLCEYVDGTLSSADHELVTLHLNHCDPCSALCTALQSLQGDLAGLAEIQPDERFVDDVLAATIYRPSLWTELNERVSHWWSRQVRRPRFALELAYSGAVVFLLLFGAPRAPLRGVPPDAVEIARANPVEAVVELWHEKGEATGVIADFGREAWSQTGAPLSSKSKGLWDRIVTFAGNVKETASIGAGSVKETSGMLWKGEWFAAWGEIGEAQQAIAKQWRGQRTEVHETKEGTEP